MSTYYVLFTSDRHYGHEAREYGNLEDCKERLARMLKEIPVCDNVDVVIMKLSETAMPEIVHISKQTGEAL